MVDSVPCVLNNHITGKYLKLGTGTHVVDFHESIVPRGKSKRIHIRGDRNDGKFLDGSILYNTCNRKEVYCIILVSEKCPQTIWTQA